MAPWHFGQVSSIRAQRESRRGRFRPPPSRVLALALPDVSEPAGYHCASESSPAPRSQPESRRSEVGTNTRPARPNPRGRTRSAPAGARSSGPHNPRMSPALPARADVVVVGGGVMGTSTAFHLAEAGVDV